MSESTPRQGILGTKLGMTQVFTEDARVVPVTVLRAGPCPVVAVRTTERDGYAAVQLGWGTRRKANKPTTGHAAKAGVEPTRHLVEIRTDAEHTRWRVGSTSVRISTRWRVGTWWRSAPTPSTPPVSS